eukprot:4589520-Pyramimonas_sp.AAC.1
MPSQRQLDARVEQPISSTLLGFVREAYPPLGMPPSTWSSVERQCPGRAFRSPRAYLPLLSVSSVGDAPYALAP